jgi:glycosyltransferase involved in cell wall biosynthesis
VNLSLFNAHTKEEARKTLGIGNDLFVVSFVGHFNDRKGITRLVRALERNLSWYAIFVGSGEFAPTFERTLFQGSVKHLDLCLYLAASDIFVLPTTAEGCCNAIIEAMACELPVVSSNRPFTNDILDDKCSIRIDPMEIDQIYTAIEELWTNVTKRREMGKAAKGRAEMFDITKRAEQILSFMEERGIE